MKVGCAICYDVRFPELFLALRRAGAELIFLPAAFTLQTGKDHWETLIRARAIETQCWIAAPATWGRHLDGDGEPRFTYGHSLIVRPLGPRGGQGLGRHRLGHRAHRSGADRAGAPRHAGAGAPAAAFERRRRDPAWRHRRTAAGGAPVPEGRVGFLAAPTQLATESRARLVARYGDCPPEQAGLIVCARRRRLHAGDAAPLLGTATFRSTA